jgi:hypothetical protein
MDLEASGTRSAAIDVIGTHTKRAALRLKQSTIALVFCVTTSFAAENASAADQFLRCAETESGGACSIYMASVIQLIANPSAFHGKRVRVIGYLGIEFEGTALYFHAEDHQRSLTDNGLWLQVPAGWPAKTTGCVSRSYALLEGTFNAQLKGHGGLYSGSLEEITRCTPWRMTTTTSK